MKTLKYSLYDSGGDVIETASDQYAEFHDVYPSSVMEGVYNKICALCN